MASTPEIEKPALLLSACVIALNEEQCIERCLQSLIFADEIVLVDGGSTDGTLERVNNFGALHGKVRVEEFGFQGFAQSRNRALEMALGRWVFFLDADEEVSSDLGRRLKNISRENPDHHPRCYSVRREEYFLGRHLKHGPGNPSHQWRFFLKQGVHFKGEVHEYPVFEGAVGRIDEAILHWPHLSIDRFINKMNRYTTLEALDRFAQGQRTSLLHAILTFFSTFLKNGIRYRGFWNGRAGLVLVLLESFSRTVRHLKLWLLWQVHEGRLAYDPWLGQKLKLPKPGVKEATPLAEIEKPEWKAPSQ